MITAYPSKWFWGVTLKVLQKIFFSISRVMSRAARHFDLIALFLGNPLLCACCPHTNVPDVRIPKTNFIFSKSYSCLSFWWVCRHRNSFWSKSAIIWNLLIFVVFCSCDHMGKKAGARQNDLKTESRRSKWVQNWRNMQLNEFSNTLSSLWKMQNFDFGMRTSSTKVLLNIMEISEIWAPLPCAWCPPH